MFHSFFSSPRVSSVKPVLKPPLVDLLILSSVAQDMRLYFETSQLSTIIQHVLEISLVELTFELEPGGNHYRKREGGAFAFKFRVQSGSCSCSGCAGGHKIYS
ncbi:hypothetical protein GALMADRAFT_138782 [Galerina marginata CBS 339.88]|uniref:Uncharacterized protein n=1 Tax=Galerina marginata (strain CBS 339.88) TaxID=685588 RepID=A0A067TCT7_GALM3|nr:hypothetical protein GALMADRAFT_138782 [Galerina marginata CBS 339.88]